MLSGGGTENNTNHQNGFPSMESGMDCHWARKTKETMRKQKFDALLVGVVPVSKFLIVIVVGLDHKISPPTEFGTKESWNLLLLFSLFSLLPLFLLSVPAIFWKGESTDI